MSRPRDTGIAAGSVATPAAVTRPISLGSARRRARVPWLLLVLVLSVSLAVAWALVARRQLAASITVEGTQQLQYAERAFSSALAAKQAELQGYCRILVEDPRLKSTLATEGIDEATVADILADLRKLLGSGFLMVLSPEGRVFAQAGAPELRGLDLSSSSVVKKARDATNAVGGSWVLAGKVMDLSIMSIRFGEDVVAYLVVGEALDGQLLASISEQTGVHVAHALATTIVLVSSQEAHVKDVFARVVAQPGPFRGRTLDVYDARYITGVVELGEAAQSHRLLLVRSVASSKAAFAPLEWMLFVPPLLVLIAVLFSVSVPRRPS